MPVARWSSSGMMPLRDGSKCWTITNARPLCFGTWRMKCSKASRPPAEAPMPMMGKVVRDGKAGAAERVTRAVFFRRGLVLGFSFMMNSNLRTGGLSAPALEGRQGAIAECLRRGVELARELPHGLAE